MRGAMDFDAMDKEELRKYLDFLMWHYRVVDAFWYVAIEEELGADRADHFNERVWDKAAGLAAESIVKRFDVRVKGLDGLIAAQRYFPWAIIVGYDIERSGDEMILSVPECPVQKARLARSLGEYNCKEMHRREFTSFARAIDPAIRVECIHAPLDPHPPERVCQWRFTMDAP